MQKMHVPVLSQCFRYFFFWYTISPGSRSLAPHPNHHGQGRRALQTAMMSHPWKAQRAGVGKYGDQLGWVWPGGIISCVPLDFSRGLWLECAEMNHSVVLLCVQPLPMICIWKFVFHKHTVTFEKLYKKNSSSSRICSIKTTGFRVCQK